MDSAPRFRRFLEYSVARALFAGMGSLPEGLGRPLGRALGRLVGALARSRSRRAADNLRLAFPGESAGRIAAWVRGMWGNVGEAAWEFSLMPSLTPERYFRKVRVEGLDLLRKSYEKGKGVVLYSAHLTNWEWTSPMLSYSGFPIAAVARAMKNSRFDAFLTRVRSSQGVTLFPHRNAVREGLRWLKAGKVLGILVDQRITAGGVEAPFFGRPARTTTMPALLALRTGAAMHGLSAYREEGGVILIRIDPALDPAPFEGDPVRATAAMAADVERWIRRDPSRWLWMHDRWKP